MKVPLQSANPAELRLRRTMVQRVVNISYATTKPNSGIQRLGILAMSLTNATTQKVQLEISFFEYVRDRISKTET